MYQTQIYWIDSQWFCKNEYDLNFVFDQNEDEREKALRDFNNYFSENKKSKIKDFYEKALKCIKEINRKKFRALRCSIEIPDRNFDKYKPFFAAQSQKKRDLLKKEAFQKEMANLSQNDSPPSSFLSFLATRTPI